MKNKKIEPIEGQEIYVPGACYVYRGEDDFAGGKAIINKIKHNDFLSKDHFNYTEVGIKERSGVMYNWNALLEQQDKLKEEYKDQIAHPDPDYSEEFNKPNADWK